MMLNQVDTIIQKVETLLRGGTPNLFTTELHNLARSLLNWLASENSSELATSSEETKTELIASAVKLHNKARNLAAHSLSEIRAILKACAGWILSVGGGDKPKVLSVVITLLSKSGQEIIEIGKDIEIGVSCLTRANQVWSRATSLAIQKDISPIDWQDMKMAIFWANLEKAHILSKTEDAESVRRAIVAATEIVQTLPPRLKLTFADRVYQLALQVSAQSSMTEEAVHYSKTALNAVDSAMLPYSPVDPMDAECPAVDCISIGNAVEVKRLRLNIQLSLVFLYLQNRDYAKAMSSIHSIEQSLGPQLVANQAAHTVYYAKYLVYLHDQDRAAAEEALWALLRLPLTPFAQALQAVKKLDEESCKVDIDPVPYYKHLVAKYPNEPEYTQVRISHLQSILTNIRDTAEGSGNASTRALEITQSIIAAHLRRENVLSGDNYHCLKRLLSERIRSERSLSHHDTAAAWCAVYMRLLGDSFDEKEQLAVVSVLRADSLIHTGAYLEAAECSAAAVAVVKSTRTLLMRFKTLLHAAPEAQMAVTALVHLLYGDVDTTIDASTTAAAIDSLHASSNSDNEASAISAATLTPTVQLENLSRIILCTYVAQESHHVPSIKRDEATQLLLRAWMRHYTTGELWRHQDCTSGDGTEAMEVVGTSSEFKDTASEDTSSNKSYLTIVCNYMHYYLLRRMIYSLSSSTRASNSNTTVNPVTTIDTIVVNEPVPDSTTVDAAEPNTTTSSSPPLVTVPVAHSTGDPADGSDFFTLLGYPDCLQPLCNVSSTTTATPAAVKTTSTNNNNNNTSYDNSIEHLSFACTLDDIKHNFLTVLEEVVQLINTLEKESVSVTVLGEVQDLTWLAHLAYNIALVLLKMPLSAKDATNTLLHSTSVGANMDGHQKSSSDFAQQMLLSARLFELCEYLISVKGATPVGGSTTDTYDRATCFLAACAARIDAEKHMTSMTRTTAATTTAAAHSNLLTPFPSNTNTISSHAITTTIPSNNLITARLNAQKAERLLTLHNDFQDAVADNMRCVALQQEFSVLCIMPDPKLCATFVKDRASDFLKLSVTDLMQCARTAQQNHTLSVEVTRTLLNLALQRGVRDACPDYRLLGTVYRELIELSPSRRAALEKVEEFTQMAMTLAHTRGNANMDNDNSRDTAINTTTTTTATNDATATTSSFFLSEDIDHIVSLAFNYGVTLGDLDQPALAERFISKAITLLACASSVVKAWLPKMQETYVQLLQGKMQQELSDSRTSQATLQQASIGITTNANNNSTTSSITNAEGSSGGTAATGTGTSTASGKKRPAGGAAEGLQVAPQLRDAPLQVEQLK